MLNKYRLSREEREAAYARARERIFGKDEKSGECTPGTTQASLTQAESSINSPAETEEGNEMSRSSSVSTKDRAGQSKKPKPAKQRRDDNESFDKRSEYTTFFPQQQMPTWVAGPQYPAIGPQPFNGGVQGNYQNPMPPQFGPPNPQFNPGMMGNPGMQYNNMPQVRPKTLVNLTYQLTHLSSFPNRTNPVFSSITVHRLPHMAHLFNHRR